MKAILITFDQAYYNDIITMLEMNGNRGFTAWEQVQGRGSVNGEPHYGTHAWPSLAAAIITIVEANKVETILDKLHEMDIARPKLGLRAFVWDITQSI